MLYSVKGLWLATGYGLVLYRLPNGWSCGRLWSVRSCVCVCVCTFTIILTHHPSYPITYSSFLSSLYLSVFDSGSLLSGPQRCPFLISSLLFYSFFHFLGHLFSLTLAVYPDSLHSSFCIFTGSRLSCPTPPPNPFPPKLLFSMDTAAVLFCLQEM